MLNIKRWRRIARKLLFEEVDNKKIILGGCCFNAYITIYLTGTVPCLGDQWVPWAANLQTLAVLSEDLPCSLPFLAYLRWILMQMLFFPENCTSLELITFWSKFCGGGWAMSWVVTGCCQPSLGFLGWTKFLKNLEGFLSICFPSVLWAGNQSQNSYLAISGSGNSCLLATSFCAVPYKDDQGWALGQNPAIHSWAGTCEAASPRALPAKIPGTAWGTGNLQGSSLWVSVQGVQGVSWSAAAEAGVAESERQWGQCSDRALEQETVAPCCYWGNEVNRHESYIWIRLPFLNTILGSIKPAGMARVVGFMTESRGTSLSKKALIRPFVGLQSPEVSLPTVDHRRVSEGHLIPGGYFSDTLDPLSLKQTE